MGILYALLAACSYGTGDFSAGLAARHFNSGAVTAVTQALGLLLACLALTAFPGVGPQERPLLWGALSGVGSAVGTYSLYHGLSVGRMSVVATLSALLTALGPVIVGIALGNHLEPSAVAGIVLALPAIALVSWQGAEDRPAGARGSRAGGGTGFGILAGCGFALLLVCLDRAGTHSGAWPLVPGQAVSVLLLLPFALRGLAGQAETHRRPSRRAVLLTLGGGVLSGSGNLLFLAATGGGQLAIVAVLTALYPAVTVLLARLLLAEHWTPRQAAGLASAAVAVVLVSIK